MQIIYRSKKECKDKSGEQNDNQNEGQRGMKNKWRTCKNIS